MKKHTIKISRSELVDYLYNFYRDYLENEAKNLILCGINLKGLNDMSDDELKIEYRNVAGIEEDIEIIEDESAE